MSDHPLYQTVREHLDGILPASWSVALRHNLVWLVLGILEARSAGPAKIAEALSTLGLSEAQTASLERRVRRIENTPEYQAATCVHPLAKYHLALGKPQQLLICIDPTTQADHIVMLTVSVSYRGRSLPLAWTLWVANRPLTGASFWERVAALLAEVATLLPAAIPIIWLADRAFGTPQFTDLVEKWGWGYVVRAQGQTRCRDRRGVQRSLASLVARRGERAKLQGQAFKKLGWRSVSIVVYWGPRHKTPLCLVSNLPPQWTLVMLYRRRYSIETLFRDYKSHGWQWEQGQVRDLEHLERLMVGMALAAWLTLMVGTQVAEEILSKPATGQRRTLPFEAKRSLFRLGLQRLKQWLHRNCRHPLGWRLTHWEAPNWQRQLLQHHTRAFVLQPLSIR